MDRVRTVKFFLWSICGLAFAVGVRRFLLGLGSSTALNDGTPWGLWVGFDVMGGVALAAGGFVLTATVYILKKDEYKPIVRAAVLTAFLGYAAVAIGLLFDLGLPWNIWHPTVYWQHHSALFEVAWCVMLYLTVLALEFLPIPLESTSIFGGVRRFLVKNRLILVILGIMLSTLHQSSLGTLFLIMPYRLYALWYSPILPVLFFVSAISLGLMMVTLESLVSTYLYRREPEVHLLSKLGRTAAWVLSGYLVIRLLDLTVRGSLPILFAGTWESGWFLLEITISILIPIIFFTHPRTRNTAGGLAVGAVSGVLGFVLNRLNVGGIAMIWAVDSVYFPAWTEFAISAGVVSGCVLVFLYAVEHFNIWEDRPQDEEAVPYHLPRFDPVGTIWLGDPVATGVKRYSLGFVLAAAIGFAFLPLSSLHSQGLEETPAQKSRGRDVLTIDANRDGYSVTFDHERHKRNLGQDKSCAICHHANLPGDEQTSCSECHRDVYLTSSIFDHSKHESLLGNNESCVECHPAGENKMASTAKSCGECHNDENLPIAVFASPIQIENYVVCSHTDAMHGLCITCHQEIAEQIGKPQHGLCITCHPQVPEESLTEWEKRTRATVSNRWVISTQLLPKNIDRERLRNAVSEVR
ncbi:MAG: NrfD/PsrC family molybdoenzyme membrane anchor subunit [bacterium]